MTGGGELRSVFPIGWHVNVSLRVQEGLPEGATLIPIILGSEKTRLTMLGGNKEAWPIYMSIGNIQAKDRNTPSNGSWVLLAYIPLAEFSDPGPSCQTLKNCLFHQCLKIILAPLFSTGVHSKMMTTLTGLVLNCFPRLGLYLADYPEQLLINIAGGQNSPVTTASSWNLGDSDPSPP